MTVHAAAAAAAAAAVAAVAAPMTGRESSDAFQSEVVGDSTPLALWREWHTVTTPTLRTLAAAAAEAATASVFVTESSISAGRAATTI